MRKTLKIVFAMIFATILFTACSEEDNPVIPDTGNGDPDPIVIQTPRYMRVEGISIRHFPKNKPNGDTWDWNLLSSTERKPDLEVVLQRSGNYLPAYWSDQRKNATYTNTYVFTEPASPNDGELPHAVPYAQTWKVNLIDDDFGGNDQMGSVTVKPSSIYQQDNATNFDKTIINGDIKVRLRGAWIY